MILFLRLIVFVTVIYFSLMIIRIIFSFFFGENVLYVIKRKNTHVRILKLSVLVTFYMILAAVVTAFCIVIIEKLKK